MAILKLLLTPPLMRLVSLAARAWGHRVSGWLTSLPIVAAPIAAVLLIGQGTDFVVRASVATLVALPAIAIDIAVFVPVVARDDVHPDAVFTAAVIGVIAVPFLMAALTHRGWVRQGRQPVDLEDPADAPEHRVDRVRGDNENEV